MKNESFFFVPSLVAILFVALKLTNVINWSWWWVLSPLWIAAIAVIVIAIVAGVYTAHNYRKRNQ